MECEICNDTQIKPDGTFCDCDGDGYCRECCNSMKGSQLVVMRYGEHGRAVHAGCIVEEKLP